MPYLDVQTNATAIPRIRQKLLEDLIAVGARHLGKSTDVTMARLSVDDTFSFRGTSEPAAYVAVRAIGLPDVAARNALVGAICALLDEVLDVPKDRVFVVFEDHTRDRWAANGAILD